MTRLLIVGPPGAGKGTQASRIAEHYGVPAIATGDIFRQNIKDGTPLGVQVKAIVDQGNYVPDEVTNALVEDRLAQPDARAGFLLDGYPRTPEQLEFLSALLKRRGERIDAVVQLVADVDEVVARMQKRALAEGRADDTEDVIRHRQGVYARETAPLLEAYRERGLLVVVDGLGTINEVAERVQLALEAKLGGAAA